MSIANFQSLKISNPMGSTIIVTNSKSMKQIYKTYKYKKTLKI